MVFHICIYVRIYAYDDEQLCNGDKIRGLRNVPFYCREPYTSGPRHISRFVIFCVARARFRGPILGFYTNGVTMVSEWSRALI